MNPGFFVELGRKIAIILKPSSWSGACSSSVTPTLARKEERKRYFTMLTKEEKSAAIKASQRDEKDVGSTEVQIALLTEKIKKLTVHMTINKHDYSSKRGMDIMIARRTNLLNYLKKTDTARYEKALAAMKAATKKNK